MGVCRVMVCMVLMTGCAARPAGPSPFHGSIVKITTTGFGTVLIPVTVGGTTRLFALDTGSSATVIDPSIAAELAIQPGARVEVHASRGEITGATEATLPRFAIGEHVYRDLRVVVMDLKAIRKQTGTGIVGLVGNDVLERHDVVIDLGRRELQLHPSDSLSRGGQTAGMVRLPVQRGVDDLLHVEVDVDGMARIPALLDLGSQFSVINWLAADELGVPQLRSVRCPTARCGYLSRTLGVRLGEVELRRHRLVIDDLPVFGRLGQSDRPAMILGVDILHDRTLVIDYVARALYVSR